MTSLWYRSLLSLHLISVISWMAGLLYLIRLFVYHTEETESVVKERFKVMEERLYRIIVLPAMGAALVFGVMMLLSNFAVLRNPWMHAKLLFVMGMLWVSYYCGELRYQLADGRCQKSSRFFRVLNEIPTLLMIVIIFLVILRPFSRS